MMAVCQYESSIIADRVEEIEQPQFDTYKAFDIHEISINRLTDMLSLSEVNGNPFVSASHLRSIRKAAIYRR